MSDNKLYLVTGANGFIASAVVKELVEGGAHVRATVRRVEAGEALRNAISSSAKGKLEIVIVPDITADGAFKDALKGATHVFHMASPLPTYGKTDAKKDFLEPAIAGTLTVLRDAKDAGTVRKVVFTSSTGAVQDGANVNKGETTTEQDWNPITEAQVLALGEKLAQAKEKYEYAPIAVPIYTGSKKFAEESAWKFMQEAKPGFALTAVIPGMVLGPAVLGGLGGSSEFFWQMLNAGSAMPAEESLGLVDLNDVVQGHIRAMENNAVDGKRILLVSDSSPRFENIGWAKEHRPDAPFDKLPIPANAEEVKQRLTKFDTKTSQEMLGIKYKDVKTTVLDFVDWVLDTQPKTAS